MGPEVGPEGAPEFHQWSNPGPFWAWLQQAVEAFLDLCLSGGRTGTAAHLGLSTNARTRRELTTYYHNPTQHGRPMDAGLQGGRLVG